MKIESLIPDIDKQGHIWAGWALVLTSTLIFEDIVSGVIATIGIAGLRELFGNNDFNDFLATVFGITIGVLIWMGTK